MGMYELMQSVLCEVGGGDRPYQRTATQLFEGYGAHEHAGRLREDL